MQTGIFVLVITGLLMYTAVSVGQFPQNDGKLTSVFFPLSRDICRTIIPKSSPDKVP